MDKLRIIVTGASGFIGTHFINFLLKKKVCILNIDIKKPNIESHNSFWKECDIKNFNNLLKIFSEFTPTHVLHLAAKANLNGRTIADFPDNTIGTQNVVNCVKEIKSIKRFFHTSTQYVVWPGIYPKSDDFHQPYTAYGESKAEAERIVMIAGIDNCAWSIIRPTNIWGPWHPAYPFEMWRFLAKRYYFHPGFKPIKKHYGYVKNTIDQIYNLLFKSSDIEINHKVFYVTDPPIDNAEWLNSFSLALSGKPIRRIPKFLWKLLGATGSIIKNYGGSFPIDSDRYFRLTVQENIIPYQKTLDVTGPPRFSLNDGVQDCVDWMDHCSFFEKADDIKGEKFLNIFS
jgi:GlcNAc-P-P-Und epimerase